MRQLKITTKNGELIEYHASSLSAMNRLKYLVKALDVLDFEIKNVIKTVEVKAEKPKTLISYAKIK